MKGDVMGIFDVLFGGGTPSPRQDMQGFDPDNPPLIGGSSPRYTYTMNVAGVALRQDAIFGNVRKGKRLTFQREPENRHDSNAVKVLCDGVQVGYIPAGSARMAADWIDGGKRLLGFVTEESEWTDNRGRDLVGVEMWVGYYDTSD